ncbi:MAG: M23 family metallopeptidase [Desulfocapsa sp.]|nr:M23 family metallopeptidase [Desulfocapsa sp.]
MSDRLHIIITGDTGNVHNLLLSKRKVNILCFSFFFLLFLLIALSYNGVHLSRANTDLISQVALLNDQIDQHALLKEQLVLQVSDLQHLNNRQAETFLKEKTTLLNTAVTELEERSNLLTTAATKLEERSNLIERIMSNIGMDLQDLPKDSSNSGGPFIAPKESIGKEVLFRSDRYLESIYYLPLGRPVPGRVTSRFGHRIDPVNAKKGYHTGVDMRGGYGQKIIATADGTVTKAFVNGSYGRYIEIDHGNGYTTKFAHMKKLLVKRGDRVKRGQKIGTVGSSGRSTGPHLHYEVCLNNNPLNPDKFMRVDKLMQPPEIPRLTAKSNIKIKHILVVAKNSLKAETSKN